MSDEVNRLLEAAQKRLDILQYVAALPKEEFTSFMEEVKELHEEADNLKITYKSGTKIGKIKQLRFNYNSEDRHWNMLSIIDRVGLYAKLIEPIWFDSLCIDLIK